ncbi:MAG: cyclase family protein [Candidatus Brocadiae bacterium]|nr:cyclase family protein [Candidatus Brocadiia bacterium]
MKREARLISAGEFDRLFESVCNWGRWGPDDERGTLNYITGDHIRKAAALVRSGRTVSLSLPINKVAGPDNPRPPAHYMVHTYDPSDTTGQQFATDYLAAEFHGDCLTHIDALCHVAYKGKIYNGKPLSSVTSEGAGIQDITAFAHGVVGKGVLLDMPRLRGTKWIEVGEAIGPEEIVAAEEAQGVRLDEGDILVFRTGHHRRRLELGSWDVGYDGEGRAGLHVSAIPLLHERKVAAFFPDGDGETVPGNVEGVPYPIHALQITAMGMVCADSLQFEELVQVCESEGRWEFMVAASPLRLPGGTGTLFNPIAIF